MSEKVPKIAVLLAAYNGEKFIQRQIITILEQKNVHVTIFISIDKSSDNTEAIVDGLINKYNNIVKLDHNYSFGKASLNFFYLIKKVNFKNFDYISFSDQDDLWFDFKLKRATLILEEMKTEAYSSNVLSKQIDKDRTQLIKKNYPQTKYDYLFESAGPGCTYVIGIELANKIKYLIEKEWNEIKALNHWDWFIYAFVRSHNNKWIIDDKCTMIYVQHENNEMGANNNIKAIVKRAKMLFSSYWFNQSVQIVHRLKLTNDPFCKNFINLDKSSFFHLAKNAISCRRKLFDKIIFLNVCLLMTLIS